MKARGSFASLSDKLGLLTASQRGPKVVVKVNRHGLKQRYAFEPIRTKYLHEASNVTRRRRLPRPRLQRSHNAEPALPAPASEPKEDRQVRTAFEFSTRYVNRHGGDDGDCWQHTLFTTNNREIHLCKRLVNDETVSSPANCYCCVENIHAMQAHLSPMSADVTDSQETPCTNMECSLENHDCNRVVLSCPVQPMECNQYNLVR